MNIFKTLEYNNLHLLDRILSIHSILNVLLFPSLTINSHLFSNFHEPLFSVEISLHFPSMCALLFFHLAFSAYEAKQI